MRDRATFLRAEWKDLVMLNYAAEPALLQRFVPRGTELDAFNGVTYLSLVAFEFKRTRMFGFRVPFYQSFEEVNLRFYVRRDATRGVVFIREFVPKSAVAAIARFAFHENYSRVRMSHRIETSADEGTLRAEYTLGRKADRCRIRIETDSASYLPEEGSVSQFITEHYWGYAAQPDGGCLEYQVEHPRWKVRNARQASFSGNASLLCGDQFAECISRNPDSAFLAEGSPVRVFKGKRIE
jgi:uncharacterized protein YqjF (DUF2071 family)